jgi:hypothetical protein
MMFRVLCCLYIHLTQFLATVVSELIVLRLQDGSARASSKHIEENRIKLKISLSSEAFGLVTAESKRVNQPIGEILDRLILEGCQFSEDLPFETHSSELEEARRRLDAGIGKIDLV